MPGSLTNSWSDNPNAPQISSELYYVEKNYLVGHFIAQILYGVAVSLLLRCMGALLDPTNRTRGGVKWGLVAHTAAMFSVLTVDAAISFDVQSLSYIDNREAPGGPEGYLWLTLSDAITIVPHVMFYLNTCLTDGFLLYRCYVIYSENYWVMILPFLMYMASLGFSLVLIYYQTSIMDSISIDFFVQHLEMPYFAISLSLNILITLMITTRLIRHSRNIRNAIGPARDNGLYNTVVTMLIESCVLYAIVSLLCIVSLATGGGFQGIVDPIFPIIQVIAPSLILLRVANRTALTSNSIASGNIGSIHFKSQEESTGGDVTLPGGNFTSSMGSDGETPSDPSENIIEEVPLK